MEERREWTATEFRSFVASPGGFASVSSDDAYELLSYEDFAPCSDCE